MPDTIIAPATAMGGALCVLRISGENALAVLEALGRPHRLYESHRLYTTLLEQHGEALDEAMAVYMRAPRSYTREDVVELHCHGSRAVVQGVLDACLSLGCRMAQPGEFTRRAFENGRLDLAQAEAVMQLISAQGKQAARASLQQLSGGASAFVQDCRTHITALLAAIDAAIDFPEEIDEEISRRNISKTISDIIAVLERNMHPRSGRVLYEGLNLVIAGSPNVGKSTLLNALAGEDRAIVTDIPGTTRDVLTVNMRIGDALFHVSDTAGLRESEDAVETIGVQRAREALDAADIALIVLDLSRPVTSEENLLLETARHMPSIVVLNKTDREDISQTTALAKSLAGLTVIRTALSLGEGLSDLVDSLTALAGETDVQGEWLIHARHIEAARSAVTALKAALAALAGGELLDLIAIDLRSALFSLGEITGESVDEAIIDRIFMDFCVGK